MNFYKLLQDILGSEFGSFAFVLSILLFIGWTIHRISTFIATWKVKEKGVDKLDEKVDKITSDLLFIKNQLNILNVNSPGSLIQSHSPISLTQAGNDVAQRMKIRDIISNNWDRIEKMLENIGTNNAYDIQQYCIEVATVAMDKLFSEEDMKKIKTFAYNEGKPLAYYGGMIGVIIRDKYFEIKGIKN